MEIPNGLIKRSVYNGITVKFTIITPKFSKISWEGGAYPQTLLETKAVYLALPSLIFWIKP